MKKFHSISLFFFYRFLQSNNISGPIPREIGNFAQLTKLYYFYFSFIFILKNLYSPFSLVCRSLSDNKISGSIPSEIGNLAQLKEL